MKNKLWLKNIIYVITITNFENNNGQREVLTN